MENHHIRFDLKIVCFGTLKYKICHQTAIFRANANRQKVNEKHGK